MSTEVLDRPHDDDEDGDFTAITDYLRRVRQSSGPSIAPSTLTALKLKYGQVGANDGANIPVNPQPTKPNPPSTRTPFENMPSAEFWGRVPKSGDQSE